MLKKCDLNRVILPSCDLELQRITSISKDIVQRQLLIATLFFDVVIVSPSFVIESQMTEDTLKARKELINEGAVAITIREDTLDLFLTKKYFTYKGFKRHYKRLFEATSSIPLISEAKIIHRSGEIGRTLDKRWLEELSSKHIFSLRSRIHQLFENKEKMAESIVDALNKIPTERDARPFVWELASTYLSTFRSTLDSLSYSRLETIIRIHLLGLYFDALSHSVDASICSFNDMRLPKLDHLINSKKISITVLEGILKVLDIYKVVILLKDWQVIETKQGIEYKYFMETFVRFMDDVRRVDQISDAYQAKLMDETLLRSKACSDIVAKYDSKRGENLIKAIREVMVSPRRAFSSEVYNHPLMAPVAKELPLLRFRDKIIEIYNSSCQIDYNSFKNDIAKLPKEKKRGKYVTKYDFRHSTFHQSTIGDNPIVKNYFANQQKIDEHIMSLRQEINTFESDIQKRLDTLINKLLDQVQQKSDTSGDKIQATWNEIKEGIKTAGHATTIIMAIKDLLGF